MSIVTEISRLQNAANTIKSKCVSFGLDKDSSDGSGKVSSSDTLDVMARALDSVAVNQTISSTITDPSGSLSIPAGYYDGSIAVSASVPVNYYITGSSTPDSSTGNDGDIYMVV